MLHVGFLAGANLQFAILLLEHDGKSSLYELKIRGHRTEPCGIPILAHWGVEYLSLILKCCSLRSRHFAKHPVACLKKKKISL